MILEKVIKNIVSTTIEDSKFGFNAVNKTGNNIKLCIIDSGLPDHEDIGGLAFHANFTESVTFRDILGHSTCLSGIIGANNKERLTGLSPQVSIFHAKAINDSGIARLDTLVASILWAIIKEVDIILIGVNSELEHQSLFDVIKKAIDSNIIVVAPFGDEKKIEFPARYSGVIAARMYGTKTTISNHKIVTIPNCSVITTYMGQRYVEVSGSSIAAAVVTATICKILEKIKENKESYDSKRVVKEIELLLSKG